MKRIRLEHVAILIAAVLLTYILMIKPIIGVADNGDFGRIIGSTGIKYIPQDNRDRYFEFVNRLYKTTSPLSHYTGYFSSQIPLVLAARLVNSFNSLKSGTFDIRCLAVVYCVIFLTAMYMNIKYNRKSNTVINILLASLMIFVFTDVGYISYFNSFYGEAVSFISLLSTLGFAFCLARHKYPKNYMLIGFFISAALLTGAKLQNAPVGILAIIFGIGLLRLRKDSAWIRIISVSSLVIVSIMFISYSTVPKDIKVCNKYQSVFFGILKGSTTPEKDLQELGIDEDLAVLAGTNYFMRKYPINVRTPAISQEIATKVSPIKVAAFYVKHPERYLQKLVITARNGFKLIQGFGNYEKSYHPDSKKIVASFRYWSDFKMKILPHSLLLVFGLFLIYYLILFFYYIRCRDSSQRLYLETLMFLGATGITQFLVPIIGDGEADISKHLFLFNVCFDAMFIVSVVWVVHAVSVVGKRVFR
jgi:hypothetical protein